MKCTNCGAELKPDKNFCEYCGTYFKIKQNTNQSEIFEKSEQLEQFEKLENQIMVIKETVSTGNNFNIVTGILDCEISTGQVIINSRTLQHIDLISIEKQGNKVKKALANETVSLLLLGASKENLAVGDILIKRA